jgi:hypothetical protein
MVELALILCAPESVSRHAQELVKLHIGLRRGCWLSFVVRRGVLFYRLACQHSRRRGLVGVHFFLIAEKQVDAASKKLGALAPDCWFGHTPSFWLQPVRLA